ncbi:MAG: hypothetical protein AAF628_16205 [Planctomycetota bacterium]
MGIPLLLNSGGRVSNTTTRNNLFIGMNGNYACESLAIMVAVDWCLDSLGLRDVGRAIAVRDSFDL